MILQAWVRRAVAAAPANLRWPAWLLPGTLPDSYFAGMPAPTRTPHCAAHRVAFRMPGSDRPSQPLLRFLLEGAARGDAIVLLGEGAANDSIEAASSGLGIDLAALRQAGRWHRADAAALVASATGVGGVNLDMVEAALRQVLARAGQGGRRVRAYGELVSVLWTSGRRDEAVALEQRWERLLAEAPVELFCGYAIALTDDDFTLTEVEALLALHGAVEPAAAGFERQLAASMRELLGAAAPVDEVLDAPRPAGWGTLPPAEALLLWLRNNRPDMAGEVISLAAHRRAAAA